MGIFGAVMAALLVLKISGYGDFSWWWVGGPLLLSAIVWAACLVVIGIAATRRPTFTRLRLRLR